MFIVDDILLAPVNFVAFIAKAIHEAVEKKMYDETTIKRELLELEVARASGEVGDEEFTERQAELYGRLRLIRERQMEQMFQVHTSESSSFEVEEKP